MVLILGWPTCETGCKRLRGRLRIIDILARREKFVDQPILIIYSVLMVVCKYIAYANLYQHMKVGRD